MRLTAIILSMTLVSGAVALSSAAMAGHAGDPANVKNGRIVYEETCIFCHGAKGKGGIPGVPDLTRKKGALAKTDAELFLNIANGFESPGSAMAMPARGGNPELSDAEVHDVLAYLREKFGKK